MDVTYHVVELNEIYREKNEPRRSRGLFFVVMIGYFSFNDIVLINVVVM